MSKPICPASTTACENEELCLMRGCVRMDPLLQSMAQDNEPRDLVGEVRLLLTVFSGQKVTRHDAEQLIDYLTKGGWTKPVQAPQPVEEAVLNLAALPDPTPAMLNDDELFDAIWKAMKGWDIGVPGAYSGYCGALGNHAAAIYSAVTQVAGRVLVPDSAEEKQLKAARLAERTCGLARHEDGTISYSGYQRIYEAMVSPFAPPKPEDVLTPAGERMQAALLRAAEQFEDYARQHRAKNTKEGDQKAETNDQMAALCRAALSG